MRPQDGSCRSARSQLYSPPVDCRCRSCLATDGRPFRWHTGGNKAEATICPPQTKELRFLLSNDNTQRQLCRSKSCLVQYLVYLLHLGRRGRCRLIHAGLSRSLRNVLRNRCLDVCFWPSPIDDPVPPGRRIERFVTIVEWRIYVAEIIPDCNKSQHQIDVRVLNSSYRVQ